MAVVVPLAILKNAFRIVGLTLLANYVDPAFLMDSALHRYGGIHSFLPCRVRCSFVLPGCYTKLERRFRIPLHMMHLVLELDRNSALTCREGTDALGTF